MQGFHIQEQLRTSQGKIKKEQLTASQGTAYCFTKKNTLLKKLSRRRMIWLLLHPRSPTPPIQTVSSTGDNMLTGEWEGVGEEPNQTTARKPSPL